MAIEVRVNEAKKVKREYPYLGKTEDGEVVLFSAPRCGTWLLGEAHKIGQTAGNWSEQSFTPLSPSESITLSNKA